MIPYLKGKTIIVTGATSGIGFAVAEEAAKSGAYVVGIGRSREKCEEAENRIKKLWADSKIHYLLADFTSLNQIRSLAKNINQLLSAENRHCIDVLINSAGSVSSWYKETSDGFELQFAVNHLAPFLLTHELLPLLEKSPSGRIITVSSNSHYKTRINFNDIMNRKHYNILMAYKRSKLANVLFTAEFNRRYGSHSKVRAFAADPGLVNTSIGTKGTFGLAKWFWNMQAKRGDDPHVPAKAILFIAGDPSVSNSREIYWKNCKPQKPSAYSLREDAAAKLWEFSAKACGIK